MRCECASVLALLVFYRAGWTQTPTSAGQSAGGVSAPQIEAHCCSPELQAGSPSTPQRSAQQPTRPAQPASARALTQICPGLHALAASHESPAIVGCGAADVVHTKPTSPVK